MSSDSKGKTTHVHPKRDCRTFFSSISVCHDFKTPNFFICSLIIAFLLLGANGENNCGKVLTADDVESKANDDLHFHNGSYSEIEDDAFANAEAAEHLDLSSNCLQNVPEYAFDNLTNVHNINLGDNGFTGYPLTLQRPDTLKNLRGLTFEKNRIPYLGEDFFKGKSTIVHMNFAQNQLEKIHDKALDPLLALRTANFSINKVTALPQVNLTQLGKLRHTDFSHNPLKTLEIGYYSSLPEVTNISITDYEMSLQVGTERVVAFLIAGNSKTISCEGNEQDILRSNVVINYNISCEDRDGNRHVLERSNLPQNSATTVMSDVISGTTTLHKNNEDAFICAKKCCVFLAIFVVLFSVAVGIIIFLCWKGKYVNLANLKLPFRARDP